MAGIVAEETYRHTERRGNPQIRQYRQLRSDLLLVEGANEGSWLQFRDVFEVDRKPIRDRDERFYKLFVDAAADAAKQAEAIQVESARYNIGPIVRTINMPILALVFFDRANQSRFEFKKGKPVHRDDEREAERVSCCVGDLLSV